MLLSLQDTVCAARKAWDSSYTTGDRRWRLKQLHGLHQMLLNNREMLVSSLAQEQGVPTFLYEQEISLVIHQIHHHLLQLDKVGTKEDTQLTYLGAAKVTQRPWGVALIICGSPNLVRFALGPLAAAVAAGNVVILATTARQDNAFVSCLIREWSTYLDPDSVFLTPDVDISEVSPETIDRTLIFDSDPSDYSPMLITPTVQFQSTSRGFKFAIVDEGKKDWQHTAQDILANSRSQKLSSDRLNAVFVRREEVDDLHKALDVKQAFATTSRNEKHISQLQIPGFRPWGHDIFAAEASTSKLVEEKSRLHLGECLESAQTMGALLVVAVSSLDEAVDMMISTLKPIAQVAILSPRSDKTAAYMRKWVDVSLITLEHICPLPLPVVDIPPESRALQSMFPSGLFSKTAVVAQRPSRQMPKSVPAIRATYENLIQPLRAEPRGERVGFFTQVEYLVKGAGATAGILALTGCVFAARAVYRRM